MATAFLSTGIYSLIKCFVSYIVIIFSRDKTKAIGIIAANAMESSWTVKALMKVLINAIIEVRINNGTAD